MIRFQPHNSAMADPKKQPPPRKPLRQRIAERKAGYGRPVESAAARLWRRRLAMLGNLLQGVALILLVIDVLPLIQEGFDGAARLNYTRITVYALVFVLGRIVRAGADLSRPRRF